VSGFKGDSFRQLPFIRLSELSVTEEVLNRESRRPSEIFVALGAAWTFGGACQESISNQAGIGNEDKRLRRPVLSYRHLVREQR